ncbi:MAG: hypothetical protein FWE42_04160 [Defluviitaleaceae bacterium]|nr:hypothetical protein [Defluviitaleaceae bacterium]
MIEKKIYRILALAVFITFYCALTSCTRNISGETPTHPYNLNYEYKPSSYLTQSYAHQSHDESADISELRAINQFNNLQLGGFILLLDENIYFADNKGIHMTDSSFGYVETLVPRVDFLNIQLPGAAAFGHLQYFNGRIYFINRLVNAIYSMNPDGSDQTIVVNGFNLLQDNTNASFITEFVIANNTIYFNYLQELGVRLKSFNLITSELTDSGLNHTPLLSLSPDRNSLQFNLEIGNLVRMNLENNEISSAMPINIDELIPLNHSIFITYTTKNQYNMFFGHGQRIFSMDSDMYAVEILYIEDGGTFGYINTLSNWIYFTMWRTNEQEQGLFNVHMYRVKNDGSELELVFENMVIGHDGWPHAFFNIVCEDIIFFKWSIDAHEIYALIRDYSTHEFNVIHVNRDPVSNEYPVLPPDQPYTPHDPPHESHSLDIQVIMGQDSFTVFEEWYHLFGDLIEYSDIGMYSTYYFEGVHIRVSEVTRVITYIFIDYRQKTYPYTYNFNGINGLSSYYDVVTLLGNQPHSIAEAGENAIGNMSYGYWVVEDSIFITLYFDDDGKVMALSLHQPLTRPLP